MFLGKPLYSHSASLHPGVLMSSGKFNAVPTAMDLHEMDENVSVKRKSKDRSFEQYMYLRLPLV